ncbi:MAG TPA: NAD-dependent deacylase [Paenalcaligenes sp.]|nr:NAD-dependent deacylase [Paenalcaligenes sp.]
MIDFDETALEKIKAARKIVFFSGAGISAESGVPTFRDDLTGLWAQYDPMELATPQAFARQPALVWGWYLWRRQRVQEAQPNAAHTALAEWQAQQGNERIICLTQNVDDLHERAGCSHVLHLHGNLFASLCAECGRGLSDDALPEEHRAGTHDEVFHPQGQEIEPPVCQDCGGYIRPGVIWFGESLDGNVLDQSFELSANCDVLIAIGTSGVVQPAAALPAIARDSGAYVIQINPQETPLDGVAHWNIRASAAQALPELYARVRES